jgi:hypothetical protein
MTIVQNVEQLLKEMDRTIRQLEAVLHRMEKTRHALEEAKALPRPMTFPKGTYLNEGPHYPGLG